MAGGGADRVADESLIKERLLYAAADNALGKDLVHTVLIRRLVEEER